MTSNVLKITKPPGRLSVALCIPVKNPGPGVWALIEGIRRQSLQPDKILILDSCSSDGFVEPFKEFGADMHLVPEGGFDHGGTRRLGSELLQGVDILIFMTQDAIPCDSTAFDELVKIFDDPRVGTAYGRQVPRKNSSPTEAHARLFNYPPLSVVKTIDDVDTLGIKTAFSSNSFAAYRKSALEDIGGFPKSCIVSEDTYVAAKMLLNDWKVAYRAEAKVLHSHDYNLWNEFRRYFDIGVFHSREPWILEKFGAAEGEGKHFVQSELRYVWPNHWFLVPKVIIKTILKYFGFRLGKLEKFLPLWLKNRCTMHPLFFSEFQNKY